MERKKVVIKNKKGEFETKDYLDIRYLSENFKSRKIELGKNVFLNDNVTIDDDVIIHEGAKIGKNSVISSGIIIGKLAEIQENVNLHKGFYIEGSKDSVTYAGNGMLSIGCLTYPIDTWLKSHRMIGKREGYTDEQLDEYHEYMNQAKEFHEKYYSNKIKK